MQLLLLLYVFLIAIAKDVRLPCCCPFFCLSSRSEAEESAVAVAPAVACSLVCHPVGICGCLAVACSFVCHSAAKRRNLRLPLPVLLLSFRSEAEESAVAFPLSNNRNRQKPHLAGNP
jgi:hypothetical protein